MTNEFRLNIKLGNAAMLTMEDVAQALRDVADKLDAGRDQGVVKDANGNTVGEFGGADFEAAQAEG